MALLPIESPSVVPSVSHRHVDGDCLRVYYRRAHARLEFQVQYHRV